MILVSIVKGNVGTNYEQLIAKLVESGGGPSMYGQTWHKRPLKGFEKFGILMQDVS